MTWVAVEDGQGEGVLPARASRFVLGEAVAAVDGPILGGLERDLAGGAAAGTNRVVHLAGAAVASSSTTTAAAVAPGLPTGRATLWVVLVPLLRVVLLIVHAEDEL